eukprot:gene2377-5324_t
MDNRKPSTWNCLNTALVLVYLLPTYSQLSITIYTFHLLTPQLLYTNTNQKLLRYTTTSKLQSTSSSTATAPPQLPIPPTISYTSKNQHILLLRLQLLRPSTTSPTSTT